MSTGWIERSREYPDGQVARWRERPVPGQPGVVERHYTQPLERFSVPTDTVRITYESKGSPAKRRSNAAPPTRQIAADPPKLGRPTGTPIRRDRGTPCIEVAIHEKALERIKHATFWKTGTDGLETGGWLAGTWTGEHLHVTDATSSDRKRAADYVEFDPTDIDTLNVMQLWNMGFARAGCWHVHPNGVALPSDTDYAAWEASHHRVSSGDRFEPYHLGVIVTPNERGSFAYPLLTAWATRRERDRTVTEPARIIAV